MRNLICRFYFAWFPVVAAAYLLVLLPVLAQRRNLVPITDQAIGHALLISALAATTLLWAALLALLTRLAAGSDRVRQQIQGAGVSAALSAFVVLLSFYTYAAARGKSSPLESLLSELLLEPAPRLVFAGLGLLLLAALGTRVRPHLEGILARLGRLGVVLTACASPFFLLFFLQAVRLSWPQGAAPRVPQPAATRPNIVIVLVDSLAFGKTSLPAAGAGFTPNLRRFAERSSSFSRALAPSNYTTPSVATVLTGKHPLTHGLSSMIAPLRGPARRESLPAELQRAGYRTAATVANMFVHPSHLKMEGFGLVLPMHGRGVRAWLESTAVRLASFNLSNIWSNAVAAWLTHNVPDQGREHPWPPEAAFADALSFLAEGGEPGFLYVHVMPPHMPYLADPPFRYSRRPERGLFDSRDSYEWLNTGVPGEREQGLLPLLESRYEESVLSVDAQLGRFLEGLEQSGRFEDSVIVVLADHGELFETRWFTHEGPYLDDALVGVPLLVHLPGQRSGRVIDAPIGLVDLAPTLLELAGLPGPRWMEGVSWKGALSGGPPPAGPVYSYTSDAIDALANGVGQSGFCRKTTGDSHLLLDLAARVVYADIPGQRGVVQLDAGMGAGGGGKPRTDEFDEARRTICLRGGS